MKTIKKLIIVLLLMLPMAVVADFMFKTLDARNGLTSSQINCIMKDSRGYMWFGTPAGLYRFDGYEFKNFCQTVTSILCRRHSTATCW